MKLKLLLLFSARDRVRDVFILFVMEGVCLTLALLV